VLLGLDRGDQRIRRNQHLPASKPTSRVPCFDIVVAMVVGLVFIGVALIRYYVNQIFKKFHPALVRLVGDRLPVASGLRQIQHFSLVCRRLGRHVCSHGLVRRHQLRAGAWPHGAVLIARHVPQHGGPARRIAGPLVTVGALPAQSVPVLRQQQDHAAFAGDLPAILSGRRHLLRNQAGDRSTACRRTTSRLGGVFLCTDTTLDGIEVVRIYGVRFKIEVTFKHAVHSVGTWCYHFRETNPLAKIISENLDVDRAEGFRLAS